MRSIILLLTSQTGFFHFSPLLGRISESFRGIFNPLSTMIFFVIHIINFICKIFLKCIFYPVLTDLVNILRQMYIKLYICINVLCKNFCPGIILVNISLCMFTVYCCVLFTWFWQKNLLKPLLL